MQTAANFEKAGNIRPFIFLGVGKSRCEPLSERRFRVREDTLHRKRLRQRRSLEGNDRPKGREVNDPGQGNTSWQIAIYPGREVLPGKVSA